MAPLYYSTLCTQDGFTTTYAFPFTIKEMLQHKTSLYKHMKTIQEYYHTQLGENTCQIKFDYEECKPQITATVAVKLEQADKKWQLFGGLSSAKQVEFIERLAIHLATLDPTVWALANLQGAFLSTNNEVILTDFILPDQFNFMHYMNEGKSNLTLTNADSAD